MMENTKVQTNVLRYGLGFLLPLIIALGYFYPLIGYSMLICMFAAIGFSFFKGRYWCYTYCPRGIFFDEYLEKISLGKKVPGLFRHLGFRVMWIMILMSMLSFRFIQSGGNVFAFGKALWMLLTVTTIVGLGLGLVYNTRIWCMFCPVGTMSNWFGKGKYPVKIKGDKCIDCNTCYEDCPMEINASTYKDLGYVNDGDCIKCKHCTVSCPESALSLN